MLASIERSHTPVRLIPDAHIFKLREHRLSGREKLAEVTPVHADERDRAATTGYDGVPKGQLQKCRELVPRHLAGSHGELAVPNAPQPTHMAIDGNVVGRISEDEIHPLALEKAVKGLATSSVAAEQAMSIE